MRGKTLTLSYQKTKKASFFEKTFLFPNKVLTGGKQRIKKRVIMAK